jgi:hypothetical protein
MTSPPFLFICDVALSELLDLEVRHLGIRSVCVEPGYFRSNLISAGHRAPYVGGIADYAPVVGPVEAFARGEWGGSLGLFSECALTGEVRLRVPAAVGRRAEMDCRQPGDMRKLCELVVDVARREGAAGAGTREVPFALPVGRDCYAAVKARCEEMMRVLEEREGVITATDLVEGAEDGGVGDSS